MVMTGYHELQAGAAAERWNDEKANYTQNEGDARGEMLIIDGHPVMEQWEKPYMFKLGEVATRNGGRVLEVGFGLGLSATSIQANKIDEHVIIEANAGVIKRGEQWAKDQPNKVTFIHGLWQDAIDKVEDNSLDGILYDTYPLNKEEQHIHQFDFIRRAFKKLKPGAILTYCNLTSIGVLKGEHGDWKDLWEKTQVPHLKDIGFDSNMTYETFKITPPDNCQYYAGHTEALVPILYKPKA